MVDRKRDPMHGVEVVKKPTRAKKPEVKMLDPDEIRRQVAPLANRLPSHMAPASAVEVIPPVAATVHDPRTADEYVSAIRQEWETAQERFVRIGELLDKAERTFARADYLELVERLPFGKSARSQLLSAYRAIRSGRVPPELSAAGYTTVYEISKMPDEVRAKAEQAGIIRPDVRHAEVKAFARDLRGSPQQPSRADLEAELKRVEARARQIRDMLESLGA